MPNLGFPEILMILVVALLVFGPRKLPELGKAVGQTLREFRQHTSKLTDELGLNEDGLSPKAAVPVATSSQVIANSAPASTAPANSASTSTAPNHADARAGES